MPEHGTYTCYSHGCRRAECRTAHTEYQRARRAARRGEEAPHGTPSGYMNWSCRCADCTQVYSDWLKNRRATKGY